MKEWIVVIRGVLTGFLLYKVYGEVGTWTTITLFLIFVGIELMVFSKRKHND